MLLLAELKRARFNMGCLGFVGKWWIRRKEARQAKKRKHKDEKAGKKSDGQTNDKAIRKVKKLDGMPVTDGRSTPGGVSFMVEIAPTKKRMPPGLRPISRQEERLDDLTEKIKQAEVRRLKRIKEIQSAGEAEAEKRAKCEERREELDKAHRERFAAKVQEKNMKSLDRNLRKLENRCRSARFDEKIKNLLTLKPSNATKIARLSLGDVTSRSSSPVSKASSEDGEDPFADWDRDF